MVFVGTKALPNLFKVDHEQSEKIFVIFRRLGPRKHRKQPLGYFDAPGKVPTCVLLVSLSRASNRYLPLIIVWR
ncbi:hypothetical protein CEXT_602871 [Caerostris extrusa]|uniref:Uncharacterized protein n=1 Tax=Caerostris extrusa TaxID=172846 RepID=A0AAV4R5L7_CAEEX|nr:hypothetical protein CEXT_602871 [Caerostris extrusa]